MLPISRKETVDFVDNYDGRLREPTVLPARLPNLLINGSSGIAVGMANQHPAAQLTMSGNAVIALIDNPQMTVDELCEIVHGPDFPTGGTIFRFEDQRNSVTGDKERMDVIRHMYATGRGRVVIRGQVAFEDDARGRISVVITELPYQVNKTTDREDGGAGRFESESPPSATFATKATGGHADRGRGQARWLAAYVMQHSSSTRPSRPASRERARPLVDGQPQDGSA